MTPKEKAKELVDNFRKHTYEPVNTQAKKCALIAVDELIDEVREYCDDNFQQDRLTYLHNVKQEIEKL